MSDPAAPDVSLPTPPLVFDQIAPSLLSFAAGYVDSCSYLGLFGLFAAQVTGSFVVAGAQIVQSDQAVLGKLLAIPVFFLGSVLVALLVTYAKQRGRSALPWALLLDFGCVCGFLLLGVAASPVTDPDAPLAFLAGMLASAGMGVQSALVRLLLATAGSTNVMTTNTTLVAIEATELVLARLRLRGAPQERATAERAEAARRRLYSLAPVLVGFLIGAATGALSFAALGFWCVLLASALILAVTIWSFSLAT